LLSQIASAQQAVCQNGGLVSSEILFNFAALALVRVAVETRHFGKLPLRWAQAGDSLSVSSFFFLVPRGCQFRKKIELTFLS